MDARHVQCRVDPLRQLPNLRVITVAKQPHQVQVAHGGKVGGRPQAFEFAGIERWLNSSQRSDTFDNMFRCARDYSIHERLNIVSLYGKK